MYTHRTAYPEKLSLKCRIVQWRWFRECKTNDMFPLNHVTDVYANKV